MEEGSDFSYYQPNGKTIQNKSIKEFLKYYTVTVDFFCCLLYTTYCPNTEDSIKLANWSILTEGKIINLV